MFNISQQLGNRLAAMEAVSREGTGGHWGKGSEDQESVADASKSSEMTRKWLKGFKAEDILRDKSLLRQQLEVRQWLGFLFCFFRKERQNVEQSSVSIVYVLLSLLGFACSHVGFFKLEMVSLLVRTYFRSSISLVDCFHPFLSNVRRWGVIARWMRRSPCSSTKGPHRSSWSIGERHAKTGRCSLFTL